MSEKKKKKKLKKSYVDEDDEIEILSNPNLLYRFIHTLRDTINRGCWDPGRCG